MRLRKNANDAVQQREPLRLHCWRFVRLYPAKIDDCSIGVLQCEGSCPITSHVDAAPHSPMGCQALLALEYSVFQSKLGDVWRHRGAIPGACRSSRLSCPCVASRPNVHRELSSGGGEVCPTCNQVFSGTWVSRVYVGVLPACHSWENSFRPGLPPHPGHAEEWRWWLHVGRVGKCAARTSNTRCGKDFPWWGKRVPRGACRLLAHRLRVKSHVLGRIIRQANNSMLRYQTC